MTRWLYSLLLLLLGVPALASPASAVAAAWEDARQLPPERRLVTRYLDASDFRADELPEFERAFAFHCNQLTAFRREFQRPRKVAPGLYAVDLAAAHWKAAVWEKLAATEPYFLTREKRYYPWPGGVYAGDGKHYAAGSFTYYKFVPQYDGRRYDLAQMRQLGEWLGTYVPVVSANWFVVQTSRQLNLQNKETGAGYYDFLGVKDRKTFLALVDLDEAKSLKHGFDLRGTLAKSGVNQNGRQVGYLRSFVGAAYYTLDADATQGRANPVRNLARGDFKHKAEEWYAQLPNGLWAFFLGDQDGKIQATAPDFIGPDKSPLNTGPDGRIHVGVSCVRCHVEGLRPVEDWTRRVLRNPAGLIADDYQKFLELTGQYFSDFNGQLAQDQAAYAAALKKLNGLTPAENAAAYARLYARYTERDYGTREIANLLGVDEGRLIRKLKEYAAAQGGRIDLLLVGLLAVPQEPLRVEHLEELLPLLWQILGGYQ